jgi:hypothetical protein
MTLEELQSSPTEPEISDLLDAVRSVSSMSAVLRRLLFQRDFLKQTVKTLQLEIQASGSATTPYKLIQ